jgi:acyl carrier protein
MSITNKLQTVFQTVFEDDTIVLTPEMTADDIEDWDSLMYIQLVVAVESAFDLHFTTAEITNLKNVGDFITLITEKNHD